MKSHCVPCFAFQGDFPMFVHSRILLTCRRHRVRVRFEKTVCTFWICANSVHTWYIPVYTMYIVLCRMFSHSPGQVSYFLAVGQCVEHLEPPQSFFMVYTWYIPGIYLFRGYARDIPGISQVYVFQIKSCFHQFECI